MSPTPILDHVKNFVWLRWRIQSNQLSRSSSIGKVIAALMLVSFCFAILASFGLGTLLGAFLPSQFSREYYFLIWDGVILGACMFWLIYLIVDIQRTDTITLDRILHLPVSFAQVFAVNYVCSLLSFQPLCLLAGGLGFILGSMFSIGPAAIVFVFPFLAFFLVLTALSYHLQGWISTLMSNPRRRRAILIGLPFCIVLLTQIPAFVMSRFAGNDNRPKPTVPRPQEAIPETAPIDTPNTTEVASEDSSGDTSSIASNPGDDNTAESEAEKIEEEIAKNEQAEAKKKELELASKAKLDSFVSNVRFANYVIPPLWLAASVDSILSGSGHFLWLTAAMFGVAVISLRSNYYSTLRFYKGETDARAAIGSGKKLKKDVLPTNAVSANSGNKDVGSLQPTGAVSTHKKDRLKLVERSVPFVHEETNAVLGMTWQSMARAPEVKMYLLLPFIAPFILLGFLQAWKVPDVDELKAAIVICCSAFSMLMSAGLVSNQFGFDRSGFRAFVLSPIRRDRILLARNLAIAPFILAQSTLFALAISMFFGLAIDKVLCAAFLTLAMLPSFGLLMNIMSILTPFALAPGSMQPQQFNFGPVVISLGLSMLLPVIVLVSLIPLGIEWLIDLGVVSTRGVPIALILSAFWIWMNVAFYRLVLGWQGNLLAKREKEILRVVTSKVE